MPAAVAEFSWIDTVEGIVFAGFGSPEVAIHSGDSPVGGHVVQPYPGGLDARGGMPEIYESTGRAHGGEGSGRHDIHVAGRFFGAFITDDIDHLFGRHHDDITGLNFLINFRIRFNDFMLLFSHGDETSLSP